MWIGNEINNPTPHPPTHTFLHVCRSCFYHVIGLQTPQARPSGLFESLEFRLDKVPASVCQQLSCNLKDSAFVWVRNVRKSAKGPTTTAMSFPIITRLVVV